MERRRTGSDNGSNSSRTSSLSGRCKNWFKVIFGNPERDRNQWESRVVDIRPKKASECFVPDRRRNNGPTYHEYDTNHRSRGKVYIFNHLKFKKIDSPRDGTMKDVENLCNALPKLGFKSKDIVLFQDLNINEIEEKLEEISTEDHTENDMLVIFILTHGQNDGKIYAHDRDYRLHEVWEHFTADKCTTLKGKPKLFFIIACRGENMDDGVLVKQSRKASVTEIDSVRCQASASYRIPIWADFLTVYSTAEGYYSYRHPNEGTWYIQSFCNELKNFSEPHMHFMDFITRVNRTVAVAYQTLFDDPQYNNKKQCPFVTSSLTKVLYLNIESNQTKTDGGVIHKLRPKSLNT